MIWIHYYVNRSKQQNFNLLNTLKFATIVYSWIHPPQACRSTTALQSKSSYSCQTRYFISFAHALTNLLHITCMSWLPVLSLKSISSTQIQHDPAALQLCSYIYIRNSFFQCIVVDKHYNLHAASPVTLGYAELKL